MAGDRAPARGRRAPRARLLTPLDRAGSVALRDIAVRVATEAADLLWSVADDDRTAVDTKSTSTDMVTEMDRASEALLVQRLLELRPDDSIIAEEGTGHPGTSGVTWVVDPLDGTTNYLYGHPGWNVSVGAAIEGVPVAGAVVLPSLGDTFAAASGAGATRNGHPLRIAPPAPLAAALVGTGFGYDPAARRAQARALATIIDRLRDVRRVGAAAGDLCSVACGRLDAYYEHGLADWDRVAGTVIAREAGARVEVLAAPAHRDLPSDCTVAAHPQRFDELIELLAGAGLLA